MQRAQGFGQVGGQVVVTQGLNSATDVQASYPQCTVTVYLTGTLTKATIYSDNASTPLSNPFTSTNQGAWAWYAANGHYDVTISGAGIPGGAYTYSDILLADPAAGSTVVTSVTAGAGISVSPNTGAVVVTNTGASFPSGTQTQFFRIQPNTGNNTTIQAATLSRLNTKDYDFPAQTPGGSLIVGNNSITLSPVPNGVNGSDSKHYLYVSAGTGTPEPCLITGGTGTSGQSSGQIIIQCAHTHSGAWTIQSATAGIQEAIIAALTLSNTTPPEVYIPGGAPSMHGQLYIPPCKDFKITHGEPVLVWDSSFTNLDGILIDSAEDAYYDLPLIIYYGSHNPVHLYPANPDPSSIQAFVDSTLIVQSVNNGGSGSSNAYLYLDGTAAGGSIDKNKIILFEAYNTDGGTPAYGILAAGLVRSNQIDAYDINGPVTATFKDSAASSGNIWDVAGFTIGTGTCVGADVSGSSSKWTLRLLSSNPSADAGNSLIVRSTAAYNLLDAITLNAGFTNQSTHQNRLRLSDLSSTIGRPIGFSSTTPAIPASATSVFNTNLLPVVITILTAGTGAFVYVGDALGAGTTNLLNLAVGQQIYLGVGESVYLVYSSAPTWQWRSIP